MGIGGCVIVFALGAILAFAVDWHLAGVNLHLVGVILMIAGLLGLVAYVRVFRRRRLGTDVVEERRYVD
ncbi:hypothetical protein AB0D08_40710 [Kitasatospora sp. NPDC048540]|uniref:hypothetical protein n=1 Tax=unclassified Kitasatospora TaxID=2633591 RepID=UPI0005398CBD|nr:hypothetical protein [Kitasatospora sp. MBT63]